MVKVKIGESWKRHRVGSPDTCRKVRAFLMSKKHPCIVVDATGERVL